MKGQLSPHSVRTQYTLYIQSNFLLRASRAAFFIDFAQPCKYTGYTQSTLSPRSLSLTLHKVQVYGLGHSRKPPKAQNYCYCYCYC